jgi:proline racemase
MANITKLITTIDSHTAGEGTRLVTGGLPEIRGENLAEKFAWAAKHLDWLPGYLLREPRGHKDLYGAVLVPPCHPEADIGVIFMNNGGYEPMCGHGLMGVATSVVELGIVFTAGEDYNLVVDTAAGLVRAKVSTSEGGSCQVTLSNVPAFLFQRDVRLELADGEIYWVDIAFGGNFFALVHADQIDLELLPQNASRLADLGMRILETANARVKPVHPELPHINHITDVRFYQDISGKSGNSRNVVILGDHMVDRSPCGTGTCAELALRYANGEIALDEPWVCESILGTCFSGCAIAETVVGQGDVSINAILPQISGSAYITGLHQFVLQQNDPFPKGFLLK